MTILKTHIAFHFSGSMLVRMSIKLSRPQRYPSSLLPSTHGLRWSRVRGGGIGTVFPKSIIQIPALPVRSCTNNKELPTTCRKTQQGCFYQSLYLNISSAESTTMWIWKMKMHVTSCALKKSDFSSTARSSFRRCWQLLCVYRKSQTINLFI